MEEKKKSKISSYTLISLTVIGIIAFIGVNSYLRIKKEHEEKVQYVLDSKIEYYAKRCYLEGKCREVMTLDDIYKQGYIKTELVNENTNEIVDSKIIIRVKSDYSVVIDWE